MTTKPNRPEAVQLPDGRNLALSGTWEFFVDLNTPSKDRKLYSVKEGVDALLDRITQLLDHITRLESQADARWEAGRDAVSALIAEAADCLTSHHRMGFGDGSYDWPKTTPLAAVRMVTQKSEASNEWLRLKAIKLRDIADKLNALTPPSPANPAPDAQNAGEAITERNELSAQNYAQNAAYETLHAWMLKGYPNLADHLEDALRWAFEAGENYNQRKASQNEQS